jgi:Ser/Thr protein kinase RdoA (MazF antagonist)
VLFSPRVSHDQAEEIAAGHYGISAAAERLAAEHDDTFRLLAADGTTRLLKIAQLDPETRAAAGASPAARFQTAVLLHLPRGARRHPRRPNLTALLLAGLPRRPRRLCISFRLYISFGPFETIQMPE